MGVKSIMANEAVEMEPSGRVLPIFRGEYDAGRTYENPDIVLYRNSSYVAKQVTVGNPPPAHALADDYWQMVARGIIDADVSDSTIEFTEASERSNIKSGEKSNIIMGKIMKFFTDLKDIAFSGRYSDLIDAPVSLKNPKVLTFTGAVTGSYDGSTAKSVAIPSVGNGTLTIQKNGTNIKTFTANQTGNVTANITVPTSASDVSAVPASKVLTTAEQINANTNSANVAGATAVKAMVNQINSNFNNYLPAYFEYVESVEGIGNSLDIPRGAKELYIIGNTPYYSIPMLLTAGQLTMYEAILGGGNHYIRFSVNRNGSGKIVITDAMQDGSTSNNARIALWYR